SLAIKAEGRLWACGYNEYGQLGLGDTTSRWTPVLVNIVPILNWTGEEGYSSDGLEPEVGTTSMTYTYRIKYKDPDGDTPLTEYPKVWILKNGTTIYSLTMNYISGLYNTGAIYSTSVVLLAPATTYSYYFEAYDALGATATPTSLLSGPITTDGIPPAAITTLVYNRIDDYALSLVWTATGDDGYSGDIVGGAFHIKYTTNPNDSWDLCPYEILKTTDMLQQSIQIYTITGLTLNTSYYFWIKISDEVKLWSELSNKTTAYIKIPPGGITSLTAIVYDRIGYVNLKWIAPGNDLYEGDIEGGFYRIDYTTNPIHIWNYTNYKIEFTTNIIPNAQVTYEIENLINDSTYYFVVFTADQSLNWSEKSNIAEIWTKDLIPPGNITTLVVISTATNLVTL
ncbi:MAG: hypothetical protein QME68_08610, partial [Elusimicrobiota bacterium]|nr:hypothetical protein [Elusimicrobiota bacterium]